MTAPLETYTGGCHCGAVRFEVEAPPQLVVHECNCSICAMTGFLHLIVPGSRFRLTSGEAALTEYRFNTGTARHFFCRTCGVKSWYVPRSNPDGYSVNLRCLDPDPARSVTVVPFDGRNWESHGDTLAEFSGELTS